MAFYFALRDTLVCDNIETATKIAYGAQRFKVVTKDGKLIDITGTMSGGGRVKQGLMQTNLRAEIGPEDMQVLFE